MGQFSLLRIYFEVSRLIGLCNLHYDARNQRFSHNHWPTVLYCLILNVAYLLIMPFALALLTGNIYNCSDVGMFRIVYNVVALTKLLSTLLLIGSVWFNRRRMQQLANDLMAMLHRFRFALGNDCRRRCLCKFLLTSSRFLLLAQQLVSRDALVHCDSDSLFRRSMAPFQIAASVYALILLLLVSYVDLTVYMIQVSGNWILMNMSEKVQSMIQDLEALPERMGLPREMGLRQILAAWSRLWRRCVHLDKVLHQLVQIFQWQLLFNLATTYVFNIATLFRLWMYLDYDEDFRIWRGIFYALLILLHHVEVMMQFSIFEITRFKWLELHERVGKLFYLNYSTNQSENFQERLLSRKLEIALFYLNRKLQLHPQRSRRLHIGGFFDLSNSTVHKMTSSIFSNVMVLRQIAYKIYG
ncbi:hypothetical protein KR009_008344 [Drosophila setifemur]|nr:hypothetical protein KR009_008344 [Drosophila setifemur]